MMNSRNSIRAGLILALFLVVLAATAASQSPQIIERAKEAVVSIWVDGRCNGTGFIISPDGYLLTNEHVVRDREEVMIRLIGGTKYSAVVLKSDIKRDLALLKVELSDLPWVRLGNSDQVQLTDRVVVIGYPQPKILGCEREPTVTPGNINALGISQQIGDHVYEDLIQIDATVKPGSSGSPVLNAAGEVIGVIVGGSRDSPFFFAIPVNIAREILCEFEALKAHLNQPVIQFKDDFSDSTSGWLTWPPQGIAFMSYLVPLVWATTRYEDGRYSIQIDTPNKYFAGVLLNLEVPVLQIMTRLGQALGSWRGDVSPILSQQTFGKDFRVQVEARQASGPTGTYGIMFRFQGEWDDSFYAFKVDTSGYYGLWKKSDFQLTTLIPWTWSSAINRGTEWNLLEVSTIGAEISLFVNGEYLTTAIDSTFEQGFIELYAAAFNQPGVRVEFDNFKIMSARKFCR